MTCTFDNYCRVLYNKIQGYHNVTLLFIKCLSNKLWLRAIKGVHDAMTD